MSNSEPEPESEPKVKAEENSDRIVVIDPDDYQKTQKLKSIQEAKDHFKEYTINENQIFKELDETWNNPQEALERRRSKALAMYGSELMPLIEEAVTTGSLKEADLVVEADPITESVIDRGELNVREFVEFDGLIVADGQKADVPEMYLKKIYRRFESIERKLGLGLELETDKGPAEI